MVINQTTLVFILLEEHAFEHLVVKDEAHVFYAIALKVWQNLGGQEVLGLFEELLGWDRVIVLVVSKGKCNHQIV